ncbi:DUF308 domain-containing protein [Stenotrophomonas tumulicola]|uniref:DUF308 domain-containing protein n=1 Tax=Stenotrophomonas tumulicola TaxID=1685415 RepID=A0A7W3FL35_9GAMM|nr:DUF308 domain-containing protein [Stenotrophomonas tumulicola]MBA8681435.1 DUF308 domain-containing protein [Stenotrophomonas tumulicola]
MQAANPAPDRSSNQWLQTYYFLRAGVSIIWIALAVVVGKHDPAIGAVLLVLYPAWDAFANYLDARKNGGLGSNPPQMLNFIVSAITAIAIGWALTISMPATIQVFGAWAIFAGVLQLATAVRRWKTSGGQWVMILSGAQSAAAGAIFFQRAGSGMPLDVTTVAPYAGVGAAYFLISAIWLTVKNARQRSKLLAG